MNLSIAQIRAFISAEYGMTYVPEDQPPALLTDFVGKRIVKEAISATTTDHDSQNIKNTLFSNGDFWSSTGNVNPNIGASDETLVYQLTSPYCIPTAVGISFYRATYQYGYPIYPSQKIQFSISNDPGNFEKWTHPEIVYACHAMQRYVIPTSLGFGSYLAIRLLGRRQMQFEDRLYYVCVRQVEIFGVNIESHILDVDDSLRRTLTTNENPSSFLALDSFRSLFEEEGSHS